MRCRIDDQRSTDERSTMCMLVVGRDPFLSGWGQARGGASFAAWACTLEDLPAVHDWVSNRNDITNPEIVHYDDFDNDSCVHLSIYPVRDTHPALGGAK